MAPSEANLTEAPAQAGGYVYQLRYGLYRALKRLLRDPTASIGIERLDDISFETEGTVTEINQLKHSSLESAQLTDTSLGLWRTIGNWSRIVQANSLNLARLDLLLVTNSSIPASSGLSKLSFDEEDRDPTEALVKLRKAALESQNQKSKEDRDTFLALPDTIQIALLRAIRVVPNFPNLSALGTEIEDILHYACEPTALSDFRSELEGWWIDRIASQFSTGTPAVITLMELDARVSYLREKYKISFLHIDIEEPTDKDDSLDNYVFVRQIRVLKTGPRRVHNAQRDFLKASAQRSKWLRQSRLDPAELNKYDNTLHQHWSTQFEILADELQRDATDDDKCKLGRRLLGWAETREIPLRGAAAQFLTSGSYHTLADERRLGWHPDFEQLFGAI